MVNHFQNPGQGQRMPQGASAGQRQQPKQQSKQQARGPRNTDYSDVDGSPGFIDWMAAAIVNVVSFPVVFFAKVLNPFVERGGKGIGMLGATAFILGVLAGADNYYQMLAGKALLPWFTANPWIGDLAVSNLPFYLDWTLRIWGGGTVVGWSAVALSLISFTFVIALLLSLLTQYVQGQAIRGRSIDAAKANYKHWSSQSLPQAPGRGSMDMAKISYKELKRTGKTQHKFIGFIAVALWAQEIISAFAAHNPLNYVGQPGLLLGCTMYAILTIIAGEVGYTLWCSTKDESGI